MENPTLYIVTNFDDYKRLQGVGVDRRDMIVVHKTDPDGQFTRKIQGRRVGRILVSSDLPFQKQWEEVYNGLYPITVLYHSSVELVFMNLVAEELKKNQTVDVREVHPGNFEAIAKETGMPLEKVERKYHESLAKSGFRPGAKVLILMTDLKTIWKEQE